MRLQYHVPYPALMVHMLVFAGFGHTQAVAGADAGNSMAAVALEYALTFRRVLLAEKLLLIALATLSARVCGLWTSRVAYWTAAIAVGCQIGLWRALTLALGSELHPVYQFALALPVALVGQTLFAERDQLLLLATLAPPPP